MVKKLLQMENGLNLKKYCQEWMNHVSYFKKTYWKLRIRFRLTSHRYLLVLPYKLEWKPTVPDKPIFLQIKMWDMASLSFFWFRRFRVNVSNPLGWIFNVNQFINYHQTSEEQRIPWLHSIWTTRLFNRRITRGRLHPRIISCILWRSVGYRGFTLGCTIRSVRRIIEIINYFSSDYRSLFQTFFAKICHYILWWYRGL